MAEAPQAIRKAHVGEDPIVEGPTLQGRLVVDETQAGARVRAVVLPDDWPHKLHARAMLDVEKKDALLPHYAAAVWSSGAEVAFLADDMSGSGTLQSGWQRLDAADTWPALDDDRIWLRSQEDEGTDEVFLFVTFFSPNMQQLRTIKSKVEVHRGNLNSSKEPVAKQWAAAVGRHCAQAESTPFARYCATHSTRVPVTEEANTFRDNWLEELMSFSTGYDSIEVALAAGSDGQLQVTPGKRWAPSVPIGRIAGPQLTSHDWRSMSRGLTSMAEPPALAKLVPHDFYLVLASSGPAFFEVMDEVEGYLAPWAKMLERRTASYGVLPRYLAQLGLDRGELTRQLGPKVLAEAGIVGSDPFLRMGSDVTLLLRPNQGTDTTLLDAGLELALERTAEGHGELQDDELKLAGTTVRHRHSKDGRISRYEAKVGDVVVLSNSPAALQRVIQVAAGKAAPLSDEADFKYMWRRDAAQPADALLYVGDAFIEHNIAPSTRILDARRAIAQAELRQAGYEVLLSRLLLDRAAPKTQKHFDGKKLSVGDSPSSDWGRPDAMTPLIDLPQPKRVTQAEVDAYEWFAGEYQEAWGDFVDPIALRMKMRSEGDGFDAHLRVLPLVRDHKHQEMLAFVGNSHFALGAGLGVSATVAIAKDNELRRKIDMAAGALLRDRIDLDWLGDRLFVGMLDTPAAANTLYTEAAPRPHDGGDERFQDEDLARLPIYAGIHVTNRTSFDVTLHVLEAYVRQQEGLEFLPASTHAGVKVMGVRSERSEFELFYALGKEHVFLALQESTLHQVLDLEAADKLATSAGSDGAQFALDLLQTPGGALATLGEWLFEKSVREGYWRVGEQSLSDARLYAMALGTKVNEPLDAETLLALTGSFPVTADGTSFVLRPYGVSDPARGNQVHWIFPEFPVQGSHAERALGGLLRARLTLGFDPEPRGRDGEEQRSLRTEVSIRRELKLAELKPAELKPAEVKQIEPKQTEAK